MFPGMGGRGGMNPKKLQQMMKQLGIDIEEVEDVEQVIIETADRRIVFDEAEVTIMDAQGSTTYQIVGSPREEPKAGGEAKDSGPSFTEEDVELVTSQTGVSEEEAMEALEAADGEPAEAIMQLTEE